MLSTILAFTPATLGCDGPSNYEPYLRNSYNLRTSIAYTDNNQTILQPQTQGTTFAIHKGIKSYFVTNSHVVLPPNPTLNDEGKKHMRALIYSIGEDRQDADILDDYNLKLVAVDHDSDLALLEFTANLDGDISDSVRWIAKPHKKYGDTDIGNRVFAVGYKMNMKKTLEPGIVSSEEYCDAEAGDATWTTIDGLPGLSGAPVYEIDNGVTELVGVATKISPNGGDTLIVDIDHAVDLLQRYLKNPGKEREKVKETLGDYYPYTQK